MGSHSPAEEQIAEKALRLLREPIGQIWPLSTFASKCEVEISALAVALSLLTEWGYTLERSTTTVTLVATPDILTAIEIGHNLHTEYVGQTILAYRSVKSTNDLATEQAAAGAVEGTIVIAEEQTSGRGRLGRQWFSPPGSGVYLSIILRPSFSPREAPAMSLMTALALADTLSGYCPGMVQIKWPNDILIKGEKTAGILAELSADDARIDHLIVGVGININQQPEGFPPEIRDLVTSVGIITGTIQSRVQLVQKFLVQFERQYELYQQSGLTSILPELRHYSSLIGQKVRLIRNRRVSRGEISEGTAVDIGPDGALIIESDGRQHTVTSGEVSVRRESDPD